MNTTPYHILPQRPTVHDAVKAFYSVITLPQLFEVAQEQLAKRNAHRFMGKRAYAKLLRAQAKRKAVGKTPYFPENIRL